MNILANNLNTLTVSVVIPLYNKGRYIERALSSVLAQTHQPLEIIVVDDGSTDNGHEKVLNFNNPKIILIRQENKGPGAARNAGLAVATGKYVSFLDADDEWLPFFLNTGLNLIKDKGADISAVWTGYIRRPDNVRLGSFMDIPQTFEIRPDTDVRNVLKVIDFICTCTAIMQTEKVKQYGGFFDRYRCLRGEDRYLFLKLLFNERIGIITEPCAIYHTESSGLSACAHVSYPQLPPYTIDATDLIEACPTEKWSILKACLAANALEEARSLAKWGKGSEARQILDRFLYRGHPFVRESRYVNFLIRVAPILPALRSLRRLIKAAS